MKNIWQKTKRLSSSRFVSIAALLVLIAAIPFTIFVNQQRTNTQQRASGEVPGANVAFSASPLLVTTSPTNVTYTYGINTFNGDFLDHVEIYTSKTDGSTGWLPYNTDLPCIHGSNGSSCSGSRTDTYTSADQGSWIVVMDVIDENGNLYCTTTPGEHPACGPTAPTITVNISNSITPTTPQTANTFSIHGNKVLDPGQVGTGPQSSLNVRVDGQCGTTGCQGNPFNFSNLSSTTNHTITIDPAPQGLIYTGITYCKSGLNCHTQSPANVGTSFTINPQLLINNGIQNGDYLDIYFHFQSAITPTPSATAPAISSAIMNPPSSSSQPYAPNTVVSIPVFGTGLQTGHLDFYYTDQPNLSFTSTFGYTRIPTLTGVRAGSNTNGTFTWVIPPSLAPPAGSPPRQYWMLINIHSNPTHADGVDWNYQGAGDIGCGWDGTYYQFLNGSTTLSSWFPSTGTGNCNVGKREFWVGSIGTTPTNIPTTVPTSTPPPTTGPGTPTVTQAPTQQPTSPVATSTQTPTNPVASNTPTQTGRPTAWRITGGSNVGFNSAISQVYEGTVTQTTPPYTAITTVQLACPAGSKTFIGQFLVDGQWVGANGVPNTVVSGTINYTGNCSGPTSTPVATATNGPTPTSVPTATSAPTPTNIPGGIQLALNLKLTAIGPGETSSPLHPQRQAQVQVFNSANTLVADKIGPVNYNASTGRFTGSVDLGVIPAGNYTVKVKTNQYLRKLFPGIRNLVVGANSMPEITLIVGDVINDNKLDILDYNTLRDCGYGNINPLPMTNPNSTFNKASCAAHAERAMADLDDNGTINAIDYNYFVRSLATQNGD